MGCARKCKGIDCRPGLCNVAAQRPPTPPEGLEARALQCKAAQLLMEVQAPSEAERHHHQGRAARGHELVTVQGRNLGGAQGGGAASHVAAGGRQRPVALHPWRLRPPSPQPLQHLLLKLDRLLQHPLGSGKQRMACDQGVDGCMYTWESGSTCHRTRKPAFDTRTRWV